MDDGCFQISRKLQARYYRQRLYRSAVFGMVFRNDDVLEVIMTSRIFAAKGITAFSC